MTNNRCVVIIKLPDEVSATAYGPFMSGFYAREFARDLLANQEDSDLICVVVPLERPVWSGPGVEPLNVERKP